MDLMTLALIKKGGNGSSGGGGESSEDTIWIELSYTSTLNHFDTNISFNEIQSLLNEGKCDIRVHFDPSGNGYANTVWHLSN